MKRITQTLQGNSGHHYRYQEIVLKEGLARSLVQVNQSVILEPRITCGCLVRINLNIIEKCPAGPRRNSKGVCLLMMSKIFLTLEKEKFATFTYLNSRA